MSTSPYRYISETQAQLMDGLRLPAIVIPLVAPHPTEAACSGDHIADLLQWLRELGHYRLVPGGNAIYLDSSQVGPSDLIRLEQWLNDRSLPYDRLEHPATGFKNGQRRAV